VDEHGSAGARPWRSPSGIKSRPSTRRRCRSSFKVHQSEILIFQVLRPFPDRDVMDFLRLSYGGNRLNLVRDTSGHLFNSAR
jgi:hypothetical protein